MTLSVSAIPKYIYDTISCFTKSSPTSTVYLPLDKGRRFLTLIMMVSSRCLDFISRMENDRKNPDNKRDRGSDLINVIVNTVKMEQKIFPYPLHEQDIVDTAANEIVSVIQDPTIGNTREIYNKFRAALNEGINKCCVEAELDIVSTGMDIVDHNMLKKSKDVNCSDFAFYQVYEEALLPKVFSFDKEVWNNAENFRQHTEEFLKKLGYERVDHPRKGDLVCYFETSGRTGVKKDFRHIGVYTGENQKVLSKFGDMPVFLHEINHLPVFYGDSAQFFRKVTNFGIEAEILKELVRLAKTCITNEGSSKKVKKHLKDFVLQAAEKKKQKIPKSCTYGLINFERYVNQIIESINKLRSKDHSEKQMLKEINHIILHPTKSSKEKVEKKAD